MSQNKSILSKWLVEFATPVVVTVTTENAEKISLQNGLLLHELLRWVSEWVSEGVSECRSIVSDVGGSSVRSVWALCDVCVSEWVWSEWALKEMLSVHDWEKYWVENRELFKCYLA